jgi:hypothetical protein
LDRRLKSTNRREKSRQLVAAIFGVKENNLKRKNEAERLSLRQSEGQDDVRGIWTALDFLKSAWFPEFLFCDSVFEQV